MDYTNLMVGDWLRFRNDYPQKELQGKIAKVRGINGRVDVRTLDGEYRNSEHPNWLEPIPITPEILADNGWEIVSASLASEIWWLDAEETEIKLEEFGNGKYYYREELDILYVHELQHLLKLCGIKQELKL